MRNWTTSGRIKIERAYEHIRHLEAEVAAFRKSRPYRVFRERYIEGDPVNLSRFHIRVIRDVDPRWGAIAADTVHNLHVALDHLWQRAIYGNRHVRRDYFPASSGLANAKKPRSGGKESGRLKTAFEILRDNDAFKVGNVYWTIRCFDDADKHDTLHLAASQIQGFDMRGVEGHLMPIALHPSDWRVIEDGAEVYTYSHECLHEGIVQPLNLDDPAFEWTGCVRGESDLDNETDLAFEVTFGKGEVLEGEPVVPTLEHMAQAVLGLAELFVAAKLLD